MENNIKAQMNQRQIDIPSTDGFMLSGLLLEPKEKIKGVVQIHPGTGIKKEFYYRFGSFLTEFGFIVVLFDYRGIGGSRPKHLRGFSAKMRDWGERDMTGVLEWVNLQYPNLPKFVIGHSIGAHMIGFMRNHHLLKGIVAICPSTGYWRDFHAPYRYLCWFLWYIFIPVTSTIFGYCPMGKVGFGEQLPKGVGREWRDWCTKKNYFSAYFGITLNSVHFKEYSGPLQALYMSDDDIANDKTVSQLMSYFENAQIVLEKIKPHQYGLEKISHFGFFSRKSKDGLWQKPLNFLEQQIKSV